jgi:hypothetical protein
MSDVSAAIAQLQVSLDNVRHNEPIWRAEGNKAQADLCRENGDSYEAAIAALSALS